MMNAKVKNIKSARSTTINSSSYLRIWAFGTF